jgi:Pyruvate/2-oxoacid:ferredoxin oxidoreductase gamma subunit
MEHKIEEISWVIGGAQGSGVDSAANIFSRTCAEAGLYVFGKREYYSNQMCLPGLVLAAKTAVASTTVHPSPAALTCWHTIPRLWP